MATANFRSMEYGMPMVCGGMNDDEFENEFEYEEAERLAENFTEDLMFHDVRIEGGYYQGFQFYVEEKYSGYFDLDKESRYCIDNENAHYYFDMCRSKAIRAADAEKRKIEKWLESLVNDGFVVLVCTARFSNRGSTLRNPEQSHKNDSSRKRKLTERLTIKSQALK